MMAYIVKKMTAHINGKEDPNQLYVEGIVIGNNEYATAKVVRAEPQGINPAILLLELDVTDNGTDGKVELGFTYQEEVIGKQFNSVTIINATDGGSADVDFLG